MRAGLRLVSVVAVLALVLAACSGSDDASGVAAAGDDPGALSGTVAITSGTCDGGAAEGSWFRMVQPEGTLADGPFIGNGESPCEDSTHTPLLAGRTGLVIGEHQSFPDPVFDDDGNALADAIFAPTSFFAVDFGVATPPVEPQTETDVDPPSLTVDEDGAVTGDLRAVSVAYNGAYFAQGAPAPDGSMPGQTSPVEGTFDEASGTLVIEWAAQIVGGPFNNFTGIWHVEGTLQDAG